MTVSRERPASAAARTMIERGVNRLPVVRDGRLVGILSRADLVRAFTRSEEELAAEIRDEILERALWLGPNEIEVTVVDGSVRLAGEIETRTDVEVLARSRRGCRVSSR